MKAINLDWQSLTKILICLFGVIGALTTKAATHSNIYFYQATAIFCLSESVDQSCRPGFSGCFDEDDRQLYLDRSENGRTCFTPLAETF
jgi:hypothetical protein